MTVLITRARIDLEKTCLFLQKHQIDFYCDPMIEIDLFDKKNISYPLDVEHIIFTSKNGVRGFCQNDKNRQFTAWCVGDETAELARKHGFKEVHSASGNAQNLYDLIVTKSPSQKFLRVARLNQKDVLTEKLTQKGYVITSLPLYKTVHTSNLNTHTRQAIEQQKIQHILFYSPKTAHITMDNIVRANLQNACRDMAVWCISNHTAKVLKPFSFKEVIVAGAPNERDLLEPLVKRIKLNE